MQINFRSLKVLNVVQASNICYIVFALNILHCSQQPIFLHFHASMHKEAGNREWLQNNLLDCSFNKIPLEKTGCWPVSCSSTFDARVSLSPDSPTQMLRQSFWILSSRITFCFFSFFLLLSLSYNSVAILVNYIHLNEQHKNHGLSHTNIHNCQTLK